MYALQWWNALFITKAGNNSSSSMTAWTKLWNNAQKWVYDLENAADFIQWK